MGEALDWVRQVTTENRWKSMKIRIGPGVYILVGAHPEAAQVILRSGKLVSTFKKGITIVQPTKGIVIWSQ